MNPTDQEDKKSADSIQSVVCDTNVLSYSGSKKGSPECIDYLNELLGRGFGLSISNISTYELLRGCDTAKENEAIEFIGNFKRYELNENVLLAAARLDNVYKSEKINVDGMDEPDIIIAATAILTGSVILTADRDGYPYPFFTESEYRNIRFEVKPGHSKSIHLCLLTPNMFQINEIFEKRK